MDKKKVTVYSCSGCSNVAQLANGLAVKLDREGLAKMSCIAGVGAGVPSLVNEAKKAESILAIDGCPIACAKKCLDNQQIETQKHIILTDFDLKKIKNEDVSPEEFERILEWLKSELNQKN